MDGTAQEGSGVSQSCGDVALRDVGMGGGWGWGPRGLLQP